MTRLEVRTDKSDNTLRTVRQSFYCMLQLFAHAHMRQFESIIDTLCADLNVHTVLLTYMYVCGGRLAASTVSV